MKRHLLATVASTALLVSPAVAADVQPLKTPSVPALFDWTGGYIGVTAGDAWASYDPKTSTAADGYVQFAANIAAINSAGIQSVKPPGFSTGVEAGYNWQSGSFLLGVEADIQALHLNGSANSGAVIYPTGGLAGNQFVISAYANSNWLATARARVGLVTAGNSLLFATGGLAIAQIDGDFLFTDSNVALQSAKFNAVRTGYAVGGGIETPLTSRLSVKAEYLYVNLGTITAGRTYSNILPQPFVQSADLKANIVRVGLNYRFVGEDPRVAVAPMPVKMPLLKAPAPLIASDWEVETGARLWLSSDKLGAPQPLLNNPDILTSRLTFGGLDAISGETFARVDHASGFFVKGFLGAGGIGRGTLNDEDFPAFGAYANTLSTASGHLAYANIDLGYTFLRTPDAKLGAFVGYNYYAQHINAYSCTQLAGADTCVGGIWPNFLVLAEDDQFNSLRLGVTSEVMLTERLRLTADAAYLPLVDFQGQDDHNVRELLLPEKSNKGNGVMLEAILGYNVTPAWNVGIGGRYWAWNMRTGTMTFNFLGSSSPPDVEPARFTAERYGVFVQTSYKWGDTALRAAPMPTKAPVLAAVPMNWTGFYIGGHLGGGWSNDGWTDPFPTAPSGLGRIDIAGFGDTIHATGPLAGGQIGYNLQSGQWVFGIQADASASGIRGENTCFSGLGGINCERYINALGTLTSRAGYAWDRSLAYVKGGAAWTNTTYGLNANTQLVTLGTGTTSVTVWGWTAGGGVEYALTDAWTALLEYDRIEMPNRTVAFPTVAVINAQSIAMRQWIDVVKLGVNYKFDWGSVLATY